MLPPGIGWVPRVGVKPRADRPLRRRLDARALSVAEQQQGERDERGATDDGDRQGLAGDQEREGRQPGGAAAEDESPPQPGDERGQFDAVGWREPFRPPAEPSGGVRERNQPEGYRVERSMPISRDAQSAYDDCRVPWRPSDGEP